MVYLVLTVVFTARCFLSGSLIALELCLARCSPIIVSGSNSHDSNDLSWSVTQELVLARFLSGFESGGSSRTELGPHSESFGLDAEVRYRVRIGCLDSGRAALGLIWGVNDWTRGGRTGAYGLGARVGVLGLGVRAVDALTGPHERGAGCGLMNAWVLCLGAQTLCVGLRWDWE